jgi:hypothetical protein
MSAISLLLNSGGRVPSRRRLFQTPLAAAAALPVAQKVQSILLLMYKSKRQINSINMIIRITMIVTVSFLQMLSTSSFFYLQPLLLLQDILVVVHREHMSVIM